MASGRRAITSHRRTTYLAFRSDAHDHERATQRGVAARLAAMMGCRFDELRDIAIPLTFDLGYVVPDVTIASLETARGIRGEDDARRDRGTAPATAATARQTGATAAVEQVEPGAPPKVS